MLREVVGAQARLKTQFPVMLVKKPFPEGNEKELSNLGSVGQDLGLVAAGTDTAELLGRTRY